MDRQTDRHTASKQRGIQGYTLLFHTLASNGEAAGWGWGGYGEGAEWAKGEEEEWAKNGGGGR